MKIGIIIYGDLQINSGGYLYDKKLVEYLSSKGMEVKVFSQPVKKNYFSNIKDNFSRSLIREISEFKPDILLEDELNHFSLFILNVFLKRRFGIPIIVIVHHLRSKEAKSITKYFFRSIEKLFLLSANGFIYNSKTTRETVESLTEKSIQNVIAYPGKDKLKFDLTTDIIHERLEKAKLKILFLGNIIERKGLHFLIKALNKIPKNRWELLIIGSPDFDKKYAIQIAKTISDLSLRKNVIFLGQIDDHNLTKEMLSSHLLAVPSSYEGFGIAYVEAMGAGLPVIAGNAGGGHEIVKPNKNGFLIKPGDVESLRKSVETLIYDRVFLKKLSLNALSSYKRMPSWSQSMDKIYEFLNSVGNLNTTLI